MIKLLGLCLLATVVAVLSTSSLEASPVDAAQEFQRFNELFNNATSPDDFRESARVLEAVVADGFRSGVVYYNLGNAYYRAGEFGRAILNYRKAKPYRPHDPLLEANLQQAFAAAPGKLVDSSKPWWSHVLFWSDSLSISNRVWIALSTVALSPILSLIAVGFRQRFAFIIACVFAATGAVFTLDAALNSPERINENRAVITGETTARKGIGKDYEAAFDAPLKDGAEFIVLQETNGWTFGHFNGIGDGWVRNEFIAR